MPATDGVRGRQHSLGTDHAVPSDHTIVYTLNTDRYRTGEFAQCDWQHSAWLMGCSYAMGIGVTDADTTAVHLSQRTGQPVINLAQGGTGIQYQVNQLTLLLSQGLRPSAVAVIWPDMGRVLWQGTHPGGAQDLWLAHTACTVHQARQAHMAVLTWRVLVSQLHVPSAELSWSNSTTEAIGRPAHHTDPQQIYYPELDLARDGAHPGRLSHVVAAEEIHLQWQGLTE